MIDAIYEERKEIAPDILFVHGGGKHRINDVVCALKAVNVPVVAIYDFDVLDDSRVLKKALIAFGIMWNDSFVRFYQSINTRNSQGNDVWKILKATGKHGLLNREPLEYEQIEKLCKSNGLFIVPVGEIECFDKTIPSEKKEWVYDILKRGDLANESKLDTARKFVNEILDFKINKEKEEQV